MRTPRAARKIPASSISGGGPGAELVVQSVQRYSVQQMQKNKVTAVFQLVSSYLLKNCPFVSITVTSTAASLVTVLCVLLAHCMSIFQYEQ